MAKMKNVVAITLVMALCFALSPMKAFAASDGKVSVEDEYVYFVVQEGDAVNAGRLFMAITARGAKIVK